MFFAFLLQEMIIPLNTTEQAPTWLSEFAYIDG